MERHKIHGTLKWSYIFSVTGNGAFPLDMLRYDSCFPYGSEDASQLDCDLQDRMAIRTVKLVHHSDVATWIPTEGRWNSFTWRVVDGER